MIVTLDSIVKISATILFGILMIGCTSTRVESLPSTAKTQLVKDAYKLMAGDVIELELPGQENLSGFYTLDPAGAIYIPVVGFVNLDDLTFEEAKQHLSDELSRYYSIKALNLKIDSYQNNEFIVIMGAVNEPGMYPIKNDLSLLKAVGQAKGFSKGADLRRIQLIRNDGQEDPLNINLNDLVRHADFSRDLILRKDDLIYIPEKPLHSLLGSLSDYLPFAQVTLLTLVTLNQLNN